MANPNVPQGTLNRLKSSVVIAAFPALNATPSFMGKEMVGLDFEGDIVTYVTTSTGAITSPEPYQKITLTIHLLKTQNLANLYKAQLEANALLGDITVYPDVQPGEGLTTYSLSNCAIQRVSPLKFDGMDAGWVVVIGGQYYVNNQLWN